MTTCDLIDLLRSIVENHPGAADAQAWVYISNGKYSQGDRFPIKAIGYDTKHKPPRIKLED
jgi:hypothetical protein